ncbi:MAG: hypothetical protein WC247_15405 [Porticoccaceae bacterium]
MLLAFALVYSGCTVHCLARPWLNAAAVFPAAVDPASSSAGWLAVEWRA